MKSGREHIYESAKSGLWKSPDFKECGCGGSGWFLSEVDTWHKCYLHCHGMPHPENSQAWEQIEVVEHRLRKDGNTVTFTEFKGTNHFRFTDENGECESGIHRTNAVKRWKELRQAGFAPVVTAEDREADVRAELEAAIGSQW